MNYSEDTKALVDAMTDGRMTQLELLAHVQHLETLGEHRAAANMYALWINHAKAPDKHYALFNYAGLLQNLSRQDEALAAYEACISLKPQFPQTYINLGLLHEKRGELTLALQTWLRLINRRYLEQPPSDEFLTMALNHIGRLQENLKNYDQAEEALEQSLLINPSQPGVIQHWVHIRQKACKWPVYKPIAGVDLADMKRYTSPLAMLALSDEPAEQLLAAQSFVGRTYTFKEEWLCGNYTHQRLRVGYVSGDFREHAVGFLLPAMLAGHDKNNFELYAYDFSKNEQTAVRAQIQSQFDHFKSIKDLTDRAAAELIRSDEIDVLIDLHGLSAGARPGIFALHPAPKQGAYLGFIGTTGMPWLDFVVSDRVALPEELQPYFAEKPLYVEGSFLPMVSYAAKDGQASRAQLGIPEGAFAMAALGNTYKITPEIFKVWMRLLKRIPQAVLCLVDDSKAGTASLRAEAELHGVTQDRLIFLPRTAHPNFCAQLELLDVYLDTYPYNCGSTTNDVVHAGLPLVTMYGKTMVSRMGLSVLTALGMPGNATCSYLEYEDKVVEMSLKKKTGHLQPALPLAVQMPIGQALKDLMAGKRESRPRFAIEQRPNPKVKIFQIRYSNKTSDTVPEGFLILDSAENSRQDWREFWPIRQYILSNVLEDDVFYGFFTPDFFYKTKLDMDCIQDEVNICGDKFDVLIFNPFWDFSAFFVNPFLNAEFLHKGLMTTLRLFADEIGMQQSLAEHVMHSENTVFGNFFVARKRFWLHWLELSEKLLHISEDRSHKLHNLLNSSLGPDDEVNQKVLIHGQLANMLLASNKFSSHASDISKNFPSSAFFGQYLKEAVQANAMKYAFSCLRSQIYMDVYDGLRRKVWSDSNMQSLSKVF